MSEKDEEQELNSESAEPGTEHSELEATAEPNATQDGNEENQTDAAAEPSSEESESIEGASEESEEEVEPEEPKIDIVAEFGNAPHLKKIEYIEELTFKDASRLFKEYSPIPEGYRRLINNKFEELLQMCFPDHYYFYKKHDGVYYFEEIFVELENIKQRIDRKSREPQQRRSLRDTLDEDDYNILKNFIDAAATDNISLIEDDIHRIRTYLFADYLEILRFCQFANLEFLTKVHLLMKANRLDEKAQREWMLIADDVKVLVTGWKEWKKNQGSVNWLKFFADEVKDILKLGTPGCFFALLQFLADNRVNVVRHGPYLEELFTTMVSLKRFNLFKMLIEKYKISRYDWFSLMSGAASTGQIAMIETLTDLEEKVRKVDRTEMRFTVMDLSIKNGYIEAFIYFFEQCSSEELEEHPDWCQAVISAISFGDYDFFLYLFENKLFKLENTRLEMSYTETKDSDKIKAALKELTPEERLIQKSIALDMDSKGSFMVTKYLLEKYMKKLDVEHFRTMKEEHLNMTKVMYLYSMVGQKKKHLNFYQSFFATETTIRRFFYCFSFSAEVLEKEIYAIAAMIHNNEYQSSKDALALFSELCFAADYFINETPLALAQYNLYSDYAKTGLGKNEKAKEIVAKFIASLQPEALPEPEAMFDQFKEALIENEVKVDVGSNLEKILKIVPVKMGERPTNIDSFNKSIKPKS